MNNIVKKELSAISNKLKISAIIVTKNEEKNIRNCLRSLNWTDEIIVIDQSSTDKTVGICKEFTDKVFIVPAKGFCEPDRPLAASKAKNDWIIYLDADEQASEELKTEIESTISKGARYNSYYIPRRNIFLGRWIKGSGWYPGYVLRLFKKGYVKFSQDIHTDVIALSSYGYLKQHIIHYTAENFPEYLTKINRFTTILAAQACIKGKRITPGNYILKLFILPLSKAYM